MGWLEITVNAPHEELDALAAELGDLGVTGTVIEDEGEIRSFLEEHLEYWGRADEDFLASIRGVSRVKFYLEASPEGERGLKNIRAALPDRSFDIRRVRDEDWENNWKSYYKPVEAGRLFIVPEWEAPPETDKKILRLDPGLIFGTGTHATTQLCLEALSDMELKDADVLDLGCGSGILAIASILLGAKSAVGADIDDKAPSVARANAERNGIGGERLDFFCGDVLSDEEFSRRISGKKFGVVIANIVADVIISLAGKVRGFIEPGGVFIASGIIEGRQREVLAAVEKNGFYVASAREKGGWHAFICRIGDDLDG